MICGLIERDGQTVTEPSLQMLTFARILAGQAGSDVCALVIGSGVPGLTETLGRYGVSQVVRVVHDQLEDYAPRAWANALIQAVADRSPQIVLAAGTDRGNEVMAHVAALSNVPMAANCTAAGPGDPLHVTRFRWGGSLLEEATLGGDPKLMTVAPFTMVAEEAAGAVAPAEETVAPTLSDADLRVRVVRREAEVAEGISLKTAPVVVGGGRGVGSAEGYAVLERLAEKLGGAVGCSRVATNNGWRPHSDQVGLTGTRISPLLYIACGISGAIQHQVGCKGSKNILVINKDPEAAFFAKADYGVIGDLHEVLPAIIAELDQ